MSTLASTEHARPGKLGRNEIAAAQGFLDHVLRLEIADRRICGIPMQPEQVFEDLSENAQRCVLPLMVAEATRIRHTIGVQEPRNVLDCFADAGLGFEAGQAAPTSSDLLSELTLVVAGVEQLGKPFPLELPLDKSRKLDAALLNPSLSLAAWQDLQRDLFGAGPAQPVLLAALGCHAASQEVQPQCRQIVREYVGGWGLPLPDAVSEADKYLFHGPDVMQVEVR